MSDYTCEHCGETFRRAWTEEDALREMRQNFGHVPEEDRVVVCDDCYKALVTDENLNEWRSQN